MKEQKTDKKLQAGPASAPVQAAAAPVDPHLEELKELAFRHGRATLLAVVIFLVVAVPIFLTRYYRDSAKAKASSLLSSATQPTDLAEIAKEYPRTPAAPLAMLALARAHYDRQDYVKAQTTYEDFLSRYSGHQMAPAAELGKAHCLEGKGLLEDALKSFEAFVAAHKDHFLTPQALLARARCLHHLERIKEAQIVLEDFLTANPKSPWKPRAEEMLEELKRPSAPAAAKVESLIPPAGTNMPLPPLLPPLPPLGN